MSDQQEKQAAALPRPSIENAEAWKAYWQAQNQQWRTEPEIDIERQRYLAERREIVSNIEQGVYPFKFKNDEPKLTRADVEWLLATYEDRGGRGPVVWTDKSQWRRVGLDLRGADLSAVDLRGLPLARTRGGLDVRRWKKATAQQREMALLSLERANLAGAHLERANLNQANLKDANFIEAHLEGANLSGATLSGANLSNTYLSGANLTEAHLERANLSRACLRGSVPDMGWAQLAAESNDTSQNSARKTSSISYGSSWPWPADLRGAFFDSATHLEGVILSNQGYGLKGDRTILLADVHWGDVNLAVVDWMQVDTLGDEQRARQQRQLDSYQAAVRANRQLANALQTQGLNEEAAHFSYRAQVLQRKVFCKQIALPLIIGLILRGRIPWRWKELQPWLLQEMAKEGGIPGLERGIQRGKRIQFLLAIAFWGQVPLVTASLLLGLGSLLLRLGRWGVHVLPWQVPFPQAPRALERRLVRWGSALISFLLILLILPGPLLLWFLLVSPSDWFVFLNHPGWLFGIGILAVISFGYAFVWQAIQVGWAWSRRRSRQAGVEVVFAILFSDPLLLVLRLLWPGYYIAEALMRYGQYVFSLFLDLLAGYGYKPGRSLFWYLILIFGFAAAYYIFGNRQIIPSFFPDAVVFSLTAFHGRGFFPDLGTTSGLLHNPLVVLAAFEAVVGLIIEISLIATFTQRFFGK